MLEDRRRTVFDAVGLAAIGGVLVAIHFLLPAGIQEQLAFDHEQFTPWSLLTAAYVHNSTQHLLNNLGGYGVGAIIAYILCVGQGRRRWFWITIAGFLFVLPILVNSTSYVAFQALGIEPTTRGFSGVVAGFAGFVLVALARRIGDRYGASAGQSVGQGVFLVLLGEIAVIYAGVPSLPLLGLLVVGLVLSFGSLGLRGLRRDWEPDERTELVLEGVFSGLVVVLLLVFVWALFPTTLVQGGTTTNIVGHGLGLLNGIFISLILIKY
jgi:hypothetical protein